MADDQPPKVPRGVNDYAEGAGQAWTALGYLMAGMLVWGFVGWLIGRWLHLGGVAIGIGIVVGMVGGIVLIVRRFAMPNKGEGDGEHRH